MVFQTRDVVDAMVRAVDGLLPNYASTAARR